MKKIKILYFHHGGVQGGAPRSLGFLIENLDKNIYDPYVICCVDTINTKQYFEKLGVKVISEPKMGGWHGSTVSGISFGVLYYNITHALPTYFKIKRIIKEIKPDIVHLNSTCLFFAAKGIKKVNKSIPIICHIREPLLPNFWGKILKYYNNKYVDRFIAIEKYDANSLNSKKKIDIIYNFVNFETYNYRNKSKCLCTEFNINKNSKILLYLARVSKENGCLEMIKSLSSWLKERTNIHLFIVGLTHDDLKYEKEVIKIKNDISNIHLLEFRKDVPDIIASSDIMLVPFIKPHFARSIIEANAMGIPAIGTNIGGVNELIQDKETGLLFDINNFGSIKDKCELLLDNPCIYMKMKNNALKYAKDNFNSNINAKKTFDIYKEVLCKR